MLSDCCFKLMNFDVYAQGLVGEGLEAPDELTQAEGTSKFSYLLDGKVWLHELCELLLLVLFHW